MNRLADESSPYLVQHASNPVDWYPWGDEALDRARAENKPIFLSIGYAACHWCHVMERESFENEEIAQELNRHFVAIKVDREERPDLDDLYMTAVTAMTGHGGWPMSVFLTPALEPFFGGTYFPPQDRQGFPGFVSVLRQIAAMWDTESGRILDSASRLAGHVAQQRSVSMGEFSGALDANVFARAVPAVRRDFDARHGGWSGAPKFPAASLIRLLLRIERRLGEPDVLDMATFTLDRMGEGGIRDHVGGGFHRYSVDGQWHVPHFEKMLYDNAQLALAYTEAFQRTRAMRYQRIARDTLDFVAEEMQGPDGAFYASLDADSEGGEGRYYVWSHEEIMAALGEEEGRFFCKQYDVRRDGNFESHEPCHRDRNVLRLSSGALDREECIERQTPLLRTLKDVRAKRVRPALDDKAISSWNGLMITSFARAAQAFGEPAYLKSALAAADRFRRRAQSEEGLLRCYREGRGNVPAFLDDYMALASAFLDVYECTLAPDWIASAQALAEQAIERFWNSKAGLFYYAQTLHENPMARALPRHDGPEPSGNSLAASALLRLAGYLERPEYEEKAARIIEGHAAIMGQVPQAFPDLLCAADFLLGPVTLVAIIGPWENEDTQRLLRCVQASYLPNRRVAWHSGGPEEAALPLAAARGMRDNRATAHVCVGTRCLLPTCDVEELTRQLNA